MSAGEDWQELDPEVLVRLGTIELLNLENIDAIDDLYADDLTYYNTDDEEGRLSGLRADTRQFHDAFPDLEGDVLEVVVDEDRDVIAFEYQIRGTQENDIEDFPPTGNRMEARGMGYARFESGEIVEYHLTFDRREMLAKLGHATL